ncbi:MAG: hypothetical protein GY711_10400 [bacterium]|nr:hypothetical protein [bacterium]
MDLAAFRATLEGDAPTLPSLALLALWHAAKGNWDAAHDLCNQAGSTDGDWVHAYLHRVEGDLSNADYWYRRAARARPEGTTEEEWSAIASELLERAR